MLKLQVAHLVTTENERLRESGTCL